MALINIDGTDPWIREFEACERLSQDILSLIVVRNREKPSSKQYDVQSANIRLKLNQYFNQLGDLKKKLVALKTITQDEEERRYRQIEQLESKGIQLRSQFTNTNNENRRELFERPGSSRNVWLDDTTVESAAEVHFSPEQLRDREVRLLEQQNEGLENLSKVIARSKDIAVRIGSEVETQNELLDGIGDGMDDVNERAIQETNRIREIHQMDTNVCCYWVIIVILAIAIVLVWLL